MKDVALGKIKSGNFKRTPRQSNGSGIPRSPLGLPVMKIYFGSVVSLQVANRLLWKILPKAII